MCGISGIFKFNGSSASQDELQKMGQIQHHRGPDFLGIRTIGSVGFAHNRLSIIDTSEAAHQPFFNDRYTLIFNGEIYNFKKLRQELQNIYSFKTQSDTEVLFFALIEWGIENTIHKLQGMFAFSFYDIQKKEMYIVRDRFGIKPLYYYQNSTEIVFSSEVKAIWAIRPIGVDPIKTMFSFYGSGETNFNHSVFQSIEPVKPGHFLRVCENGQVDQFCYYDLVDQVKPDEYIANRNKSRKEIQNQFNTLFDESVQKIMVADVPIGVFQSGGIDSSLISATAYQHAKPTLFSSKVVEFSPESIKAQEVADYLNTPILYSEYRRNDYLTDIVDVTWHYETPIISHMNSIPMARVAKLARETGVKVVLTGEGSDEMFLGYPGILFKQYKDLAMLPYKLLKKIYSLIPGLAGILPSEQAYGADTILKLLDTDFFRQYKRLEFDNRFDFLEGKEKEMLYSTIYMFKELLVGLLHRNDRMGMKSSIEARFPFLYEPLVEFSLNVPVNIKYRKIPRIYNLKHPFMLDKALVRDCGKGKLPDSVVDGKKWGFGTDTVVKMTVSEGFFTNGYIGETMKLSKGGEKFILSEISPKLLGRLASIEIFGRLYHQRESKESITGLVQKHISFKS